MSAFDQGVVLTENEINILKTVEEVVEKAVVAGNSVPAFDFANDLLRQGQIRGLALAKLFYLMKSKWAMFQSAGTEDNFEDVCFAETGRSPETVSKYVNMWEAVFENKTLSKDIKNKLMGKPIGDLLLITATVREGVDQDTMMEIIAAPDKTALREVIQEIRGTRTSAASALKIHLQRRDSSQFPVGCIYIRKGANTTIIGSLDVFSEDEDVQKAIVRIVNSAHLIEVN